MSHVRAAARPANGTVVQRRVVQSVAGATPGRALHPVSRSAVAPATGLLAGAGPAFRLTPLQGAAGAMGDSAIQRKALTTAAKDWQGITWQVTGGKSEVFLTNGQPVGGRFPGDSIFADATVTATGGSRADAEAGFVQNVLSVTHVGEYVNADRAIKVTHAFATPLLDSDGHTEEPWFKGRSFRSVSGGEARVDLQDGPGVRGQEEAHGRTYRLKSVSRRVEFGYWVMASKGDQKEPLQKGAWASTCDGTGGELADGVAPDRPPKLDGTIANRAVPTKTVTRVR